MQSDEKIYRNLQRRIDKLPIGFPATKTGEEIRILKYLFTPEEAKIAINLSMFPETIEQIFKRVKKTGISKKKLEQMLDKMIENGSIAPGKLSEDTEDVKYYCITQLVIGMYELQGNRMTEEFSKDFFKYFDNEFGKEFYITKINQLRAIPVEQSISYEKYVETYDNLEKMLENIQGPFAVAPCVCRDGMDIIGKPCKKTDILENCLTWEGYAKHNIMLGIARPISKEEMFEILKKSQNAGLIIQTANTKNPGFICCCCGCCCVDLVTAKRHQRPAELFSSTYQAIIDSKSCNGCTVCIDRCQMDAIDMKDNLSSVNLDRCIGCGLCVLSCSSDAIHLQKRKDISEPPETPASLYLKILTKKIGKFGVIIKAIRKKLGMKI